MTAAYDLPIDLSIKSQHQYHHLAPNRDYHHYHHHHHHHNQNYQHQQINYYQYHDPFQECQIYNPEQLMLIQQRLQQLEHYELCKLYMKSSSSFQDDQQLEHFLLEEKNRIFSSAQQDQDQDQDNSSSSQYVPTPNQPTPATCHNTPPTTTITTTNHHLSQATQIQFYNNSTISQTHHHHHQRWSPSGGYSSIHQRECFNQRKTTTTTTATDHLISSSTSSLSSATSPSHSSTSSSSSSSSSSSLSASSDKESDRHPLAPSPVDVEILQLMESNKRSKPADKQAAEMMIFQPINLHKPTSRLMEATNNTQQAVDKRRFNRPLTGKHVKQGTGASSETLATLRKLIGQRQKQTDFLK